MRCARWPDYVTFHIDIYVYSTSATYTRYGDAFWANGVGRPYPNPLSVGVNISNGWLLACNPSRDDINNFLIGWASSVSGYAAVGGSYNMNSSGSSVDAGVGFGGFSASPGSVNSYRGNIFGDSWHP